MGSWQRIAREGLHILKASGVWHVVPWLGKVGCRGGVKTFPSGRPLIANCYPTVENWPHAVALVQMYIQGIWGHAEREKSEEITGIGKEELAAHSMCKLSCHPLLHPTWLCPEDWTATWSNHAHYRDVVLCPWDVAFSHLVKSNRSLAGMAKRKREDEIRAD